MMADLFAPVDWGAQSVANAATPAATTQVTETAKELPVAVEPVAAVATVADWKLGLRQFRKFRRPYFMDEARWLTIQADARALGDIWAEELFGFGWSALDLFGWHPKPWCAAVMPSGLIRFLDRRPLGRIGPCEVEIVQRTGPSTIFRRREPACNAEFDRSAALPLWIVFSPENVSCAAL